MQARKHRHKRRLNKRGKTALFLLILALVGLGYWLVAGLGQATRQQTASSTNSSSSASQNNSAKTEQVNWVKQDSEVKLPILMYHAVHVMAAEEAANANLIVDPTTFDSHIKALKDAGYYFLSPEEAYKVLTENVLPNNNAKIVWLTFDDGNLDFYTVAYPILKNYQAKATNNVITNYVENGNAANITVAQMLEMKENGMSFQSHTANHPDLSATETSQLATEFSQSKEFLNSQLNQDTIALAYPSGRYNDTVTSIASQYYKLAVTTDEGVATASDGLMSLKRVRILPNTTADGLLNQIG
ncbi:polysaccharide deacetylase family protein [Streptococcus sp. DD12]|uniref:polysaccharide deacetylase family protein n=1 Tax=Streptococcus sp. DD12 TaxID=1777880 RepID=UPI000795571D|nr:polysaccharide deacetylase family protein [Streptococcus sp. DD12]KXT76564.1 Polysaccharide deacetylase [Streptococcus sp. DD12]